MRYLFVGGPEHGNLRTVHNRWVDGLPTDVVPIFLPERPGQSVDVILYQRAKCSLGEVDPNCKFYVYLHPDATDEQLRDALRRAMSRGWNP